MPMQFQLAMLTKLVRPSFRVPQHFNLETKFPLYFIRLYTQVQTIKLMKGIPFLII